MLITTRRTDEALIIDGDITLTVISVKGNQVKIGIDAPEGTIINREEIFSREDVRNFTQPKKIRSV
jgi:carbon storage regulator